MISKDLRIGAASAALTISAATIGLGDTFLAGTLLVLGAETIEPPVPKPAEDTP